VPGGHLLGLRRKGASGGMSDVEFEKFVESLSKRTSRELGLEEKLNPVSKAAWTFFCPQCRTPRALRMSASPWKLRHVFQVGLTTVVFALLASPWLSWKGIVAFVPFWMVFEAVYRLKLRNELCCRNCGLDPLLYLTDVNRARDEMMEFWKKKYQECGLEFPPAPETLARARVAARRKAARSPSTRH